MVVEAMGRARERLHRMCLDRVTSESRVTSGSIQALQSAVGVLKGDYGSECSSHLMWAGLDAGMVHEAIALAGRARGATGQGHALQGDAPAQKEPEEEHEKSAEELEADRAAGIAEEEHRAGMEAEGADLEAIDRLKERNDRKERESRAPRIGFLATSAELRGAAQALLSAGGKGSAVVDPAFEAEAAAARNQTAVGDAALAASDGIDVIEASNSASAESRRRDNTAGDGGESSPSGCGRGCRCVCGEAHDGEALEDSPRDSKVSSLEYIGRSMRRLARTIAGS